MFVSHIYLFEKCSINTKNVIDSISILERVQSTYIISNNISKRLMSICWCTNIYLWLECIDMTSFLKLYLLNVILCCVPMRFNAITRPNSEKEKYPCVISFSSYTYKEFFANYY